MRVVEVAPGSALCERAGERVRLDTMLLAGVVPGDFVLAFQGAALRTLDPDEARRTDAALAALAAATQGSVDVDRHFADLAGRVPQLPPHLRRDR